MIAGAGALRTALGGIRLRLTLAFLAVTAVVFVAAGVSVQASFLRVLDNGLEAEAAAAGDVVAQQLAMGAVVGELPWRPSARLEYFVQSPGLVRSGVLAAGARYTNEGPPAAGPAGVGYEVRRTGGLVEVTRTVPGDPGTVVSVFASVPGGGSVDQALTTVGVPTLLVLAALVVAVVWFTVGLVLAPVERIRAAAEEIGRTRGRSGGQVPVPDSDDELRWLAETLNGMLSELEDSSERQREFISDASHELRTPIATLRTLAATEPAVVEDWRGSIEAAVIRLERLVEDLFTLARLDEFGLPSVGDVDLDAVCEQAVATVSVVGAERGVTVTTTLEPVRLTANAAVLERVVVNLAANAVRHADTQVVVSCWSDGTRAWIAVDDDGPGIPPESREQVFERFVRLESGRERSAGGAGLGLSIVAEAVAAHNGTVRGEDSALGGARFVVELPVG